MDGASQPRSSHQEGCGFNAHQEKVRGGVVAGFDLLRRGYIRSCRRVTATGIRGLNTTASRITRQWFPYECYDGKMSLEPSWSERCLLLFLQHLMTAQSMRIREIVTSEILESLRIVQLQETPGRSLSLWSSQGSRSVLFPEHLVLRSRTLYVHMKTHVVTNTARRKPPDPQLSYERDHAALG